MSESLTPPAGAQSAPEKLSPADFRTYNRMADGMQLYHNSFRHTWNTLYSACGGTPTGPFAPSPSPLSARQLIREGLAFCSHLTLHHTIEEQHIFPVLGARMPEFAAGATPLQQHAQIHEGLEALEEYLEQCRAGERELRREEVKGRMEAFGGVLWAHLDEEVAFLGAENMRRFWSLKEMRQMPM